MLHFMTSLQPWFRTRNNMSSLLRVCCHTAHICELSGGQRTTLDAILRNAIHLLVTRSLFSLELTNEARLRILHLSQRDFRFELGTCLPESSLASRHGSYYLVRVLIKVKIRM